MKACLSEGVELAEHKVALVADNALAGCNASSKRVAPLCKLQVATLEVHKVADESKTLRLDLSRQQLHGQCVHLRVDRFVAAGDAPSADVAASAGAEVNADVVESVDVEANADVVANYAVGHDAADPEA